MKPSRWSQFTFQFTNYLCNIFAGSQWLSCPSSTYGGNQAISQQKPSLNNELSKGNFKHHMKHFLDGQKFWYPVNSVRYSPKWTSLVAHTVESTFNVGDLGSISGLGRSSGGGHGNLTPVFLPGESPWTKEPGSSKRAGHNWAAKRTRAHTHTHTHTHIHQNRNKKIF